MNAGRTGGAQRWWLAAAVLAGIGEIVAVRYSSAPQGITHRRFGLLANLAAVWALFVLTAALLWRVRATRTVVVVALILGVALRITAITPKAPLSDDLYRYAWDGKVQAHGVDPYRYPPLATELRPLRDHWLFPADYVNGTRINRPDVRTIYPPVAEGWFAVLHFAAPEALRDRGYELAGLLVELALLAVLLALLRGERRRYVALYALCPLPIIEAVQNAHVDGLAALFVLAMVLALRRGNGFWAALALAAATLVKLYPAVLLPVLLRSGTWRERLARLGVFVGAIVLSYLPHVLAVGPKVLGYLPGYLKEEQYNTGTRYQLVDLVGLHGHVATAVVVLGVAAAAVWVLVSKVDDARAAAYLFVVVLLLATPVQPWYALCLVALVGVTGEWWLLAVCAGVYPLFFGVILREHVVGYGQLGYGVALLVVLAGAVWLRCRPQGSGERAAELVAAAR